MTWYGPLRGASTMRLYCTPDILTMSLRSQMCSVSCMSIRTLCVCMIISQYYDAMHARLVFEMLLNLLLKKRYDSREERDAGRSGILIIDNNAPIIEISGIDICIMGRYNQYILRRPVVISDFFWLSLYATRNDEPPKSKSKRQAEGIVISELFFMMK